MNTNEKKYTKLSNDNNNQLGIKSAEKWAVIGVVGNLILTVIKFAAGIFGRSSAMVADAIHSASDIFASLFVFISLKIAKKPADESHPYGHHKAEVISTIIVAILLWGAGIQIVRTAIAVASSGNLETPKNIALYAAILSIIVKELMYRFTYRVGVRTNSPSTKANALDHRSDAYSSVATLIGITGAKMGYPILDPIAGIVVSLFIFKIGAEIVFHAVKQIMDANVDNEKIDIIKNISQSVEGVIEAHDVRVRQSGSVYLVDMHIVVESDITIKAAHDISEIARVEIINTLDNISEVMIHLDTN
jgi:cation diffusion facilitator family transporter